MHEKVGGKTISEEELCILQIGPNTIGAEGTWVGGDIEVLFVCLHGRASHWYTSATGNKSLNYKTFCRKFISSQYNSEKKIKKFITVANHLDLFPKVRMAIILHLNKASRKRLRCWKLIYLHFALLWTLSKDEVLEVVLDMQRDPKDSSDPRHEHALCTALLLKTRVTVLSQRSELIVCYFFVVVFGSLFLF